MLYDISALRGLTQGNNGLLVEIITVFLSNVEENLAELEVAMDKNDVKGVEFFAHSIKGSAGQFKARAMFDLAYEMELLARDGQLATVPEKLSEIAAIYTEMKPMLEKEP